MSDFEPEVGGDSCPIFPRQGPRALVRCDGPPPEPEMLAYRLTRLWLQEYYLTYPEITVENEVTKALSSADNFLNGPTPLLRDDQDHPDRGFTVRDRHYLSARWPGDAYAFARHFAAMLA